MERDCSGNTQQTGWFNLTTGAFTTGVPPAGVGACGDSRSISVSGILCDVTDDGTVHGLVLVEYHYADDGSIDSVRLVDAATGTTYVLQGTLSICPSGEPDGDESPGDLPGARQVVERCACDDVDGDGVGEVRYIELWSVDTTGATAPFLVGTYVDGDFDQPYIPQNPVDCAGADGGDASPGEPTRTCAPQIIERCGCDDADGDGVGDVQYTELWAVDPCTPGAAAVLLGTWRDGDFDQPYMPVAPVDCGGAAGGEESPGPLPAVFEVAPVSLCVLDDTTGSLIQNVLAEVVYDQTTGERTGLRYVDAVDGSPVALPGGSHLGVCPPPETCSDCSTLLLCDTDPTSPATLAGTAATGTLANGVTWSSKGSAAFPPGRQSDGAAWWGVALLPNSTVPLTTYTFDQPVTADFSVAVIHSAGTGPGENTAQLPAGAIPLVLPPGYTYDRTTSILTVDATVTDCAVIETPTRANSARFRVTGVTTFGLKYLGSRSLVCQQFGSWLFGAIDVSVGGHFLRTVCRDCDGAVSTITDTVLDGTTPYTTVGEVAVCEPPESDEPCPSTVQILRLCDLNPDVDPDPNGNRCATPFLRHLVYDCTGTVTSSQDTATDGVTAYTPVQVVDCGTSGVPALSEVEWPQTGIIEDPALPGGQDFIYTVTNPDTGDAATVHLHASRAAGGPCGVYDPTHPVFNNPTSYTLGLSPEAQAMTRFRLDFLDLDAFEGVNALTPRPDSIVFENGTGTYDPAGGTIRTSVSGNPGPTVYAYWNSPPATITWGYANTGGGTACCFVGFLGTTLKPGGCCSGCGGSGGDESPGEECRDTSSSLLCDVSALTKIPVFDPGNVPGPDGWQVTSFTGANADAPPAAAMPYDALHPTAQPDYLGARPDLLSGTSTVEWTGYDAAPVRWVLTKTFTAPEDGMAVVNAIGFRGDGGARVRVNGQDVGLYGQWNQPAVGGSTQVPVSAGPNVIEIEVRDTSGVNWVTGQLTVTMTSTQQFMRRQVTDCDGNVIATTDTTLDGQPYTVTGQVGQCEQVQERCPPPPPELRVDVETHVLCVLDADDAVIARVLAEYVYDDQTGDRIESRYVDLVTGDPYTLPAGATLDTCDGGADGDESRGDSGPCHDAATVLLCDAATTSVGGTATFTDRGTDIEGQSTTNVPLPGGGPSLWAGEAFTFPEDADGSAGDGIQVYRNIAASVTVPRPECDTSGDAGMATVTASVRVTLDGPVRGSANDGLLSLWVGNTLVANDPAAQTAPVGWQETLTVTAQVPSAALVAGDVTVQLALETFQLGAKSWTADQFTSTVEFTTEGCSQQFFRKIVTDCETGTVVSTTDTLLDGTPYTVTGTVGQCVPQSSGDNDTPLPDMEVVELCDVAADGAVTSFLRHLAYTDDTGIPTKATDTGLDGLTPYAPTGTVGFCGGTTQEGSPGEPECAVSSVLESCRCDDTDGDGIADTDYVELFGVDCAGVLSSLGTYLPDLSAPYTPVAPVACESGAAPGAVGVQAHRVEVSTGSSWVMPGTGVQSVTALGFGTGEITTVDGSTTLHDGESVTWSVARSDDAMVAGPLAIAATTGTVTITYTRTTTL
ncbi:hypothetical protein ACFYSJ_39455 [Streptomyces sp. NPDC005248]|uniref:hypothetical protein n=1 Tax=Streptomyces sp. NPDC005248 TaxID=3364709 RepID=UPI0036CAA366